MPRADYRRCRNCGRSASEVGPLSHTRLCGDCGKAILEENIDGIHAGEGPEWERRRYGIVVSTLGPRVALALKKAGVLPDVLLDDLPSVAQTGR